jgi:hypothetical protein
MALRTPVDVFSHGREAKKTRRNSKKMHFYDTEKRTWISEVPNRILPNTGTEEIPIHTPTIPSPTPRVTSLQEVRILYRCDEVLDS